jgi:4-hydroxybutyryl-CoA dehydratase/vinylacetyl-CoA-Delta-isomerase
MGTGLIEDLHGAGSSQTQRIMISRLTDLEAKKALARTLAGIGKCENKLFIGVFTKF